MRRPGLVVSIFALLALSGAPPASAEAPGPTRFIETLAEKTIAAITRENVSDEARFEEFGRLFRESFDIGAISRFALGRHWRRATEEQRTEYRSLFADFIIRTYAGRFRQYSGETLTVDEEREVNERDTIVSSRINTRDGPSIRVDWRVRTKGGDHRIVDIVVEGVSTVLAQREEFASMIRRGGGDVESLIAELRERARPAE